MHYVRLCNFFFLRAGLPGVFSITIAIGLFKGSVNMYVSNVLNRESFFGVGTDGVLYLRPEL